MMRFLPMLVLLFGVVGFALPVAAEEPPLIAFGDTLPPLSLALSGPDHDRIYLGLGDAKTFAPNQVKAEVLLVELMNVHCSHCQMQAPSYNELFKLIEMTPQTRGRIKIVGIAIGNLPGEVETFRRGYQVPFPIVADPRFIAHRALGASATPFSLYIRQGQSGEPGLVAKTHLGLNTDYRRIFAELQRLLDADLEELRRQGAAAVRIRTAITPLYSEQELESRVRQAFTNTGGELARFEKVELQSGRRVYAGLMRRDQQERLLFAEVSSRQSVCDVCHDVHFIYLFDTSTRIVGFEPLQVTKYGNVLWSDEEAEKMRQRVVGQYLTAPRSFDPKVDAVSSATISSAIIFDSISQGESLLEELRNKGF